MISNNFIKKCKPDHFEIGTQQDASEFLIYILNKLNEEEKKLNSFSNFVEQSFAFQLKTECKCNKCNSKSITLDTCFYLPLSFDNTFNEKSVQSLLNDFFLPVVLSFEDNNSYYCTNCKSNQNGSKIFTFGKLPSYLIISFNRFALQNKSNVIQYNKLLNHIILDLKIDLSAYDEFNNIFMKKYILHCIVVHSGLSLNDGHYYSYINWILDCEQYRDNWYLINDSIVSKVSFESISLDLTKSNTPFILFYSAIDENETDYILKNEIEININSNLLKKTINDNKKHQDGV